MNDNQEMVDGYGVPFSPHTQLFHWQHVKAALDQWEKDRTIVQPTPPEPVWKDSPAGHYEKGSGI